jgi:hypothetical protein
VVKLRKLIRQKITKRSVGGKPNKAHTQKNKQKQIKKTNKQTNTKKQIVDV